MCRVRLSSVVAGSVVWLGAVAAVLLWLQRYSAQDGMAHAPAAGASAWLETRRAPGRALAVMVIHPLCPCTGASLSEFGDFVARAGPDCDALLIEADLPGLLRKQPDGTSTGAEPSAAGAMHFRDLGGRRVPVLVDMGGTVAKLLGAATSGHVVMQDADGRICFHGGITIARGHRGRSPAQDAMLAAVAQPHTHPVELCGAPVYGCALEAPASAFARLPAALPPPTP